MGFLLQSGQLVSRRLRVNQIAQRFDNFLDTPTATNAIRRLGDTVRFLDAVNADGSIVDKFWNIGKGLVGFLGSLVKGIQVSATAIVGWLRGAWTFLINFDWNATDTALIGQMDAANLTLASVWGGFTGELLGTAGAIAVGYGLTIAVGAGINLLLPGIGSLLTPRLAKSVALETLKERLPELWDSLKNALSQTMSVLGKNLATSSFILARRLLKKVFPDMFGQWGSGERWTIATAFEEWVESATGIDWFNIALEEAAEEFDEAFWETGFVFASYLDRAIQEAQVTRNEVVGETIPQVTIELDPNTNESIILPNQPSVLAQQQVLTEISQFRRLRNRDVGMVMGEPLRDYVRASVKAPSTIDNVSLKILCFSLKTPPFWSKPEGQAWDKTEITVPRVKRSKLDWGRIRLALGGASGFTLGPWTARAELADTSGQLVDKLICSADSEYSAVELCENLAELSELEILRINCSKQTKKGKRGIYMYRDPIRVYPGFCTILNIQKILNEEEGRTELTGAYRRNSSKLDLWGDAAPPTWDAEINDLLTSPGSDV